MPLTPSAPAETGPPTKDETSAFRLDSPFKRSILGVIENLLPSSPELLSVPETPTSQIRLSSPFSTDKNQLSPQARKDVSLICQSPVSREKSTKRDFSGPRKRLISPPQDSRNAKRSTSLNTLPASGLNVPRCVKVAQSDVRNKGFERFGGDSRIRETSPRNGSVKIKTGSHFTLITEQKPTDASACGELKTRLRVNAQAAAARVQKCSPATATRAEEREAESEEKEDVGIGLNALKGDQDEGPLNPGRAEGTVILFVCGGGKSYLHFDHVFCVHVESLTINHNIF